MKKSRLLIVDDEPLIRSGIRDGLAAEDGVVVADECGSVAEAVEALRTGTVDLVLLDVELPDGTGFDVIRQVGPQHMPALVFVTAYDKYAIQAFQVNALDYLLKPFDQSRLIESVRRVRQRLAGPEHALAEHLEALLRAREKQWRQTLVVRNEDRYDFISVEAVDWIEAANNYVILHCRNGNHTFSESMTGLEEQLDPSKFLRVHRSIIVNSSRIAAAYAMPGGVYELELRGGARLTTGRRYREEMRKLLGG